MEKGYLLTAQKRIRQQNLGRDIDVYALRKSLLDRYWISLGIPLKYLYSLLYHLYLNRAVVQFPRILSCYPV